MKRSLGTAIEQADSYSSKLNRYYKTRKARYERRKAKKNPEAPASYGRYRGYLS